MPKPVVHVVADLCPVGCDAVGLVRCKPSGRIVAFCTWCQAIWSRPSPSRWREGDFDTTIDRVASEGVELPGIGDVQASEWARSVIQTIPPDDWIGWDSFADWKPEPNSSP